MDQSRETWDGLQRPGVHEVAGPKRQQTFEKPIPLGGFESEGGGGTSLPYHGSPSWYMEYQKLDPG